MTRVMPSLGTKSARGRTLTAAAGALLQQGLGVDETTLGAAWDRASEALLPLAKEAA